QSVPTEEPREELSDDAIKDMVQDGILPQDMVEENGEAIVYDHQKLENLMEQYRDNVKCTSTIIAGNNMVIQVENANDFTIPKIVVRLSSPDTDQKQDMIFYQVRSQGKIVIPIEKKPDELPPAVVAEAIAFMTENDYRDIADRLTIVEQPTDMGLEL
ncbi:MAG: hypothetical protein RR361_06140, partial [Anaerovorax sp.]